MGGEAVSGEHQFDAGSARMALARDEVIWGLPLVLFGRYLDAAIAASVPFNRFFMNTETATPLSHAVGPNIDTLNGRAWLDLSEGPQVIGVPDMADRYYSVQLQDMYMNSFAYIGRRTTGTKAGWFAITPPGFSGELPEGVTRIEAPTSKVLAFVRTLVRGRPDLPVVQTINATFTLGALADFPGGQQKAAIGPDALDAFQPDSRRIGKALPHDEIARAGTAYFDDLDQLVRMYPPSSSDTARLVHFAAHGRGSAKNEGEFAAAVPAAFELIRNSLQTRSDNGWSRRPNVAPFIEEPLQRAANHLYGPGTQVADESVFWNKRQGPDGSVLSGLNRYRLRFAKGQLPPVDAFWSLTLYDRNYFLFSNPLDRFGITDRDAQLRYGIDGSLELLVQTDEPDEGPANWLPAPRDDFQLVLRTYQPLQPILDGTYLPPPLEIVGAGTPVRTC
jgi:hypothetical protein